MLKVHRPSLFNFNFGASSNSLINALSVYFSSSVLLFFNPLRHSSVHSFKRELGLGIYNNYDVTRVISNFYLWIIAFVLITFIFNKLIQKILINNNYHPNQKRAIIFGKNLLWLSYSVLFINGSFIFLRHSGSLLNLAFILSFFLQISLLIYVRLGKFYTVVSFKTYYNNFLIAFFLSCVLNLFANHYHNFKLCLIISIILFFIILNVVSYKTKDSLKFNLLLLGTSILPLLFSLSQEFLGLIFSWGGYSPSVSSRNKIFQVIFISVMLLVFYSSFYFYSKNHKIGIKTISYSAFLIGAAVIATQIPWIWYYATDIFEGANFGVPVSGFYNFDKLQFVDTLGAHGLSVTLEGLIYGFLNNDTYGAIYSPYQAYVFVPILTLIFYKLLSSIISNDYAFLITLFVPFAWMWNYFGIIFLVPLVIINYLKKTTYLNAILVALACLFCSVYRLDAGMCADMGCVFVLLYLACSRKFFALKKLVVTLLAIATSGIVLYVILCLLHNVDPVERFKLIYYTFSSQISVAYDGLGDNNRFVFVFTYYFSIIVFCVALFYVFFIKKNVVNRELLIILSFALGAFFINLQRILSRHCVLENAIAITGSLGCILLILVARLYFKKRSFPLCFSLILAGSYCLFYNNVFADQSLADNMIANNQNVNKINSVSDFSDSRTNEVRYSRRVKVTPQFDAELKPLEAVVDYLLKKDETYIDFMNRSFTYAALVRDDPVFIAQTPLLLMGEYTQEQYVKELKENQDKVPLAIFPYLNDNRRISQILDGVHHNVRYYKVAEYLYSHYVPLCFSGEYAVWCLNSRYDEYRNKFISAASSLTFKDRSLISNATLIPHNASYEVVDNKLVISFVAEDPFVVGFEKILDLSKIEKPGLKSFTFKLYSDTEGDFQVFYSNNNEQFTEANSVHFHVTKGSNELACTIPVLANFAIRLDIPERSTVSLESVDVYNFGPINLGYDNFYAGGVESYKSLDPARSQHQYDLGDIAVLWGEKDLRKASDNPVVLRPERLDSGYYSLKTAPLVNSYGNYLKFVVDSPLPDDTVNTLVFGNLKDGTFTELYKYPFRVKPGRHTYVIRVSIDYWWYTDSCNAFKFAVDDGVQEPVFLSGD